MHSEGKLLGSSFDLFFFLTSGDQDYVFVGSTPNVQSTLYSKADD